MPNVHANLEVRFPRLNPGGKEYTLYGQGVNGKIEAASFASDFLLACDAFSITYLDDDPDFWPEAQPMEIYLDGALQFLGRAEVVKRGGGKSTANITGRDYLLDLTECDVDASFAAKTGMTLEQCLLEVLSPCGITSITTPIERNAARSKSRPGNAAAAKTTLRKITAREVHDLRPRPGEKCFAYANRLVVRAGATIQPGMRRSEIVVQGPTYDYSTLRPQVISRRGPLQRSGNNAINPESERNWSAVPSYLLCANQTKRVMDVKTSRNVFERDVREHAADYFDVTTPEFRNILALMAQGRILPGHPRSQSTDGGDIYRLRYVRDVKSRTQEQLDGFGYRALATALKDTLKYTAKFRGLTDDNTGVIWTHDSMVDVQDDINRVWDSLWVSARHIDWSTAGVSVGIECLRPSTFQIEIPD
jgi:hypothetical protein